MKILFYIEPHPIRDRYDNFLWVGREYAKMIENYTCSNFGKKQYVETRILISRHNSHLIKEFPRVKYIGLTSEENDDIEKYYTKWDSASIAIWKELMSGTGEVTKFYKRILARVKYEVFDFDYIVYWSTNGAVKSFALEEGILSISMELGCIRSPLFDSIYFDYNGVNGNSITRELKSSLFDMIEDDDKYWEFLLPRLFWKGKSYDASFECITSKYNKQIYENPEKNILIPLQLDDDSNILLFSKYNNMLEFLKDVLPKLVGKGYRCFVKPHPGNKHREITYIGHCLCEEYCSNFKQNEVIWLDDLKHGKDYASLLLKMQAVVTVNSSLGFEAMCYKRIVICMGESSYDFSLLPTLDDLVQDRIVYSEYLKTIDLILQFMFNYYLVSRRTIFDFSIFLQHINRQKKICDIFDKTTNNLIETMLKFSISLKDEFILETLSEPFIEHKGFKTTEKISKKYYYIISNKKIKKLINNPKLFFYDMYLKYFKYN